MIFTNSPAVTIAQQSADATDAAQNQFFQAIQRGDAAQVVALLRQNESLIDTRNEDGATPILWATYTGHRELVPLMTAHHALDFFEACATGFEARFRQLLSNDPTLPAKDSPDGFTPLGLAVFFGHVSMARSLIDSGADVNRPSQNSLRVAPLHSAVASHRVESVKLLIEHGAVIDPVEFLGATPLHSAAAEGSAEMVQILLKAGADRARKTNAGETPADLALKNGHNEVAALLK